MNKRSMPTDDKKQRHSTNDVHTKSGSMHDHGSVGRHSPASGHSPGASTKLPMIHAEGSHPNLSSYLNSTYPGSSLPGFPTPWELSQFLSLMPPFPPQFMHPGATSLFPSPVIPPNFLPPSLQPLSAALYPSPGAECESWSTHAGGSRNTSSLGSSSSEGDVGNTATSKTDSSRAVRPSRFSPDAIIVSKRSTASPAVHKLWENSSNALDTAGDSDVPLALVMRRETTSRGSSVAESGVCTSDSLQRAPSDETSRTPSLDGEVLLHTANDASREPLVNTELSAPSNTTESFQVAEDGKLTGVTDEQWNSSGAQVPRSSIALPPRKRLTRNPDELESGVAGSTDAAAATGSPSSSPSSAPNFRSCWKKFAAKSNVNGPPTHRAFGGKPMYDCRTYFQKLAEAAKAAAASKAFIAGKGKGYFHRNAGKSSPRGADFSATSPRVTRSQSKPKKSLSPKSSPSDELPAPVRKSTRKKSVNKRYGEYDNTVGGKNKRAKNGDADGSVTGEAGKDNSMHSVADENSTPAPTDVKTSSGKGSRKRGGKRSRLEQHSDHSHDGTVEADNNSSQPVFAAETEEDHVVDSQSEDQDVSGLKAAAAAEDTGTKSDSCAPAVMQDVHESPSPLTNCTVVINDIATDSDAAIAAALPPKFRHLAKSKVVTVSAPETSTTAASEQTITTKPSTTATTTATNSSDLVSTACSNSIESTVSRSVTVTVNRLSDHDSQLAVDLSSRISSQSADSCHANTPVSVVTAIQTMSVTKTSHAIKGRKSLLYRQNTSFDAVVSEDNDLTCAASVINLSSVATDVVHSRIASPCASTDKTDLGPSVTTVAAGSGSDMPCDRTWTADTGCVPTLTDVLVLSTAAFERGFETDRPPSRNSRPPSASGRPPSAGVRPPSASGRPPSAGGRPPSAGSRPPSVGRNVSSFYADCDERQRCSPVVGVTDHTAAQLVDSCLQDDKLCDDNSVKHSVITAADGLRAKDRYVKRSDSNHSLKSVTQSDGVDKQLSLLGTECSAAVTQSADDLTTCREPAFSEMNAATTDGHVPHAKRPAVDDNISLDIADKKCRISASKHPRSAARKRAMMSDASFDGLDLSSGKDSNSCIAAETVIVSRTETSSPATTPAPYVPSFRPYMDVVVQPTPTGVPIANRVVHTSSVRSTEKSAPSVRKPRHRALPRSGVDDASPPILEKSGMTASGQESEMSRDVAGDAESNEPPMLERSSGASSRLELAAGLRSAVDTSAACDAAADNIPETLSDQPPVIDRTIRVSLVALKEPSSRLRHNKQHTNSAESTVGNDARPSTPVSVTKAPTDSGLIDDAQRCGMPVQGLHEAEHSALLLRCKQFSVVLEKMNNVTPPVPPVTPPPLIVRVTPPPPRASLPPHATPPPRATPPPGVTPLPQVSTPPLHSSPPQPAGKKRRSRRTVAATATVPDDLQSTPAVDMSAETKTGLSPATEESVEHKEAEQEHKVAPEAVHEDVVPPMHIIISTRGGKTRRVIGARINKDQPQKVDDEPVSDTAATTAAAAGGADADAAAAVDVTDDHLQERKSSGHSKHSRSSGRRKKSRSKNKSNDENLLIENNSVRDICSDIVESVSLQGGQTTPVNCSSKLTGESDSETSNAVVSHHSKKKTNRRDEDGYYSSSPFSQVSNSVPAFVEASLDGHKIKLRFTRPVETFSNDSKSSSAFDFNDDAAKCNKTESTVPPSADLNSVSSAENVSPEMSARRRALKVEGARSRFLTLYKQPAAAIPDHVKCRLVKVGRRQWMSVRGEEDDDSSLDRTGMSDDVEASVTGAAEQQMSSFRFSLSKEETHDADISIVPASRQKENKQTVRSRTKTKSPSAAVTAATVDKPVKRRRGRPPKSAVASAQKQRPTSTAKITTELPAAGLSPRAIVATSSGSDISAPKPTVVTHPQPPAKKEFIGGIPWLDCDNESTSDSALLAFVGDSFRSLQDEIHKQSVNSSSIVLPTVSCLSESDSGGDVDTVSGVLLSPRSTFCVPSELERLMDRLTVSDECRLLPPVRTPPSPPPTILPPAILSPLFSLSSGITVTSDSFTASNNSLEVDRLLCQPSLRHSTVHSMHNDFADKNFDDDHDCIVIGLEFPDSELSIFDGAVPSSVVDRCYSDEEFSPCLKDLPLYSCIDLIF